MFPEIPADLSALSDAELEELHNQCVEAFNEATAEGNELDDDAIAALSDLADGIDTIRAEQSTRQEAAETRQAKVNELAGRVNASDEGDEGEEKDPEDEDKSDEEGDEDKSDDDKGESDEDKSDEGEPEDKEEKETVTASAKKKSKATVSSLRSRTPARQRPSEGSNANIGHIVAAADVPGYGAGQRLNTIGDVAKALAARHRTLGRGNGDSVPVASFQLPMPKERHLSSKASADENMEKILGFDRTAEGIQAAAGLCAPTAAYYDQVVYAGAERPVRDSLARFSADRGGIRFNPSPTLADITGGYGRITNAQHVAGGEAGTKTCLSISCKDTEEVIVDAIYSCLQIDNFNARTHPEGIEAWTALKLARWAQFAETGLLDGIAAGSTPVVTQGLVGAAREIIARIGQTVAGFRSRHRMSPTFPFRVHLPSWVRDLMRSDLARTLGEPQNVLGIVDSQINTWFSNLNVNITWYLDSKTGGGQIFPGVAGGQRFADGVTTNEDKTFTSATAAFTSADIGATISGPGIPSGTVIASINSATSVELSNEATATATGVQFTVGRAVLAQYPEQIFSYIFPEGTWLHLDGGTLDLGLVRDSTLNSTNEFQLFAESFEGLAKIGPESIELRLGLNPTGAYAAAKAVAEPINS